jgi:hypothetical protein
MVPEASHRNVFFLLQRKHPIEAPAEDLLTRIRGSADRVERRGLLLEDALDPAARKEE